MYLYIFIQGNVGHFNSEKCDILQAIKTSVMGLYLGFVLLFLERSMNGFTHLRYQRAGFCLHLLQRCIYIYIYGDPLVHPQTESSWANFNPIGMFSHCSKPIYLHFHCSNKLVVSLNLLQLVHDACWLALPQSNSYEISKVLFHCNMIKGFSINSQM
jgi:hypothetical protein